MRLVPFLTLLAVLGLAACERESNGAVCPAGETCLNWGNGTEAATLDPQLSNLVDEAAIIGDLMQGLTTDSPTGQPVPAMAESWTTSPEGLVWIFHLRDAKWSDGKPVTADDFVYAYRRILDPKTASIYAYMLTLLKNGKAINEGGGDPATLGARAIDARTLELTLEHPAPYLPQLTRHQSWFPVPKHMVERYGDDWTDPGRYVSNGAYKLIAWKLGDRTEVVKNPLFWDAANVCVDRILYFPTPDNVSAERRVASGDLDLNTNFQSNRVTRLRRDMPAYVRTHVSQTTSYLSFNTRDVVPLKDVRVRRALSMAVDRQFITDKLMRAGQVPAYSFVPPIMSGYVKGPRLRWADLPFAERQRQARALLAQAGFTAAKPLHLIIKSANSPDTLLLMEAVQADWRAIGVDVDLEQNEGQVAFAAYRMRDFEVGSMSWYADFDDPINFLALFRKDTGAQNYGDYDNPAYDALLDQSDREPDLVKRAQLMARAEQMMLDDEAFVPIFFGVNRALVNPKVTGWVDNPTSFHRARWLCVKR